MNNEHVQQSAANGLWTLVGFLLGAATGAGVALLLAPDAGVRTRERIGSAARRWGQSAADSLEGARDAVTTLGSDAQAALQAGQESFARDRGARHDAADRREMASSEVGDCAPVAEQPRGEAAR